MTQHATPDNLKQARRGRGHYLWNSAIVDTVDDDTFDPRAWDDAGQLAGQARGRGTAWFLKPAGGRGWVLRHSRRGGVIANISDDAYIWLGAARCRVFQEFRLLLRLAAKDLPVPAPVAARVLRSGLTYTGDLITVQIADARPLADWLLQAPLAPAGWQDIGETIARFHAAGVYHHDLNARNILLDDEGHVALIDFDKSAIRGPGAWREKNIARLRRSLDKIAGQQPQLNFTESDWQALQAGYRA